MKRHRSAAPGPGRRYGFSLTELLIAMTVLGILATLVLPAYTAQLRQARRSEGMGAVLELAARLEGFYADHGTYRGATLGPGTADIHPALTPNGYYRLSIDAQSATGYTVSATPTRTGSQDQDPCGRFTLNSLGVRTAGDAAPAARCWR